MSIRLVFPITGFDARGGHPENGDQPTNGTGSIPEMDYSDPRAILSTNLRALMQYAKEHEDAGPRDGVALQARTEELHPGAAVSDSAISRYVKQQAAANVDHLAKIAQAYDLQVWQLLYPNLEPANPPVLRRTATEEELYALLDAGRKLLAQGGIERVSELPSASPDRRHRTDSPLPSKNAPERHKP